MPAPICPRPCPTITGHETDLEVLRTHLLQGFQCVDSWLALSAIVPTAAQRKDCLERAAVLAPADQDLQIAYLEAQLALNPADTHVRQRLKEWKILTTLRASSTTFVVTAAGARPLGDILVELGYVSRNEVLATLNEQRRSTSLFPQRIGDLLLEQRRLSMWQLAHALIVQQQERSRLRTAPQALGEFLVEQGYLKVHDLERALTEQMRLDRRGQRMMLGELLVQMRLLNAQTLDRVLKEYEQRFWTRFH